MTDLNPLSSSVSLDDLLEANRQKFDQIFERQMSPGAAPAAAPAPPAVEEPAPGEAAAEQAEETATQKAEAVPVEAGRALIPVSAPAPGPRPRPAGRRSAAGTDVLQAALGHARHEMAAMVSHLALSPTMQGQHAELPTLTDAVGRVVAGRSAAGIARLLKQPSFDLEPSDVVLQSDPYRSDGGVSHVNDWMLAAPVFVEAELVGFSAIAGHMRDVGGGVPGSMPAGASSIFAEGLRIPPLKLYARGAVNQAVLDLLANNSRTGDLNHGDLMALVAGCRTGAQRLAETCVRFGVARFRDGCAALRRRSNDTMRQLIVQQLPEEPVSFEDFVDDDGRGNGPFRLKLTVWREGEQAYFDWTGTAAQAPGPVNFYLQEDLFKTFVGARLARQADPLAALNDGYHELIHVTLPDGTLLNPHFPAALGCHGHAFARQYDVLGGALSQSGPEPNRAAGFGASPRFAYSGVDRRGRPFRVSEELFGGLPGRATRDGRDGHALWPHSASTPTEQLELGAPLLVERCASIADSGGAGRHRGGNGVEKVYLLLEDGEISIQDDRQQSQPWGIKGGGPGACSEKWLARKDGEREPLPAKADGIAVSGGDRVIFRTAGGGGWGDPLEREPRQVRQDVLRQLLSAERARGSYGVVLAGEDLEVDAAASEELRESLRRSRKPRPLFDFGERPGSGARHA